MSQSDKFLIILLLFSSSSDFGIAAEYVYLSERNFNIELRQKYPPRHLKGLPIVGGLLGGLTGALGGIGPSLCGPV